MSYDLILLPVFPGPPLPRTSSFIGTQQLSEKVRVAIPNPLGTIEDLTNLPASIIKITPKKEFGKEGFEAEIKKVREQGSIPDTVPKDEPTSEHKIKQEFY